MNRLHHFQPERLSLARRARGLRKIELARLIGVSSSQISKYESGDQSPSSRSLEKISSVLAMRPEYFVSEPVTGIEKLSPVYYRSLSAATKQDRETAEARTMIYLESKLVISRYVDLPKLNLPIIEDAPDRPELIDGNYIEAVAERVRSHWKIYDRPIDNITRLFENNGLFVSFSDLISKTLDGFSYRFRYQSSRELVEQENAVICVSTFRPSSVRIRFSLCHELGHLLLHRKVSETTARTSSRFKLMEEQANHFAGAFLFPQKPFMEELPRYDLLSFKESKWRWKMSIGAMIFRAKNLDLIDEDTEFRLKRSYGARKWAQLEPFDESIPIEFPEVDRDALSLIFSETPISRSDFLDSINLTKEAAEDILCLPSDFLKDNVIKLRLKEKKYEAKEQLTQKNDESYQLNILDQDSDWQNGANHVQIQSLTKVLPFRSPKKSDPD